jgi:hypothetical protein
MRYVAADPELAIGSPRNSIENGPLVSGRKLWSQMKVQEEAMIIVRSTVIATSAWVLVALAGCATTHSNMRTSAGRLERSADTFARETRAYFRDAPEFAGQAHDFRETVDRAGDRDVILAYEQLWRSYYALRHEVERSDSRQAQVDLKPVTQAFRDVVRDIPGYADADPAIYARGGFQHDQYYDP